MLQPSDHHYIGDRDPGLLFHVRMVHYQSQRTGIEDIIFPFCIFYGGSVSDGHVHPVTDSGQSETQHSVEYLDHLSGIWSRIGGIYVCRLYEIHSAGDRGSIHDRWM